MVAVIVAAAGALLSACGSGPSQITSAAIVGNSSVPLTAVQQQLAMVLRKEPGAKQLQQQNQLDALARNIVRLSVQHELVQKAAKDEGLVVDEAQITGLIDQQGGPEKASTGTIWDASTYRQHARDQLLLLALGRKYVDRLAVTFDYTQAPTRADALAKAQELARANVPQQQEIIKRDQAAHVAVGLNVRIAAIDHLQDDAVVLFGATPGTVLTYPMNANGAAGNAQWLVAVIRQRTTNASTSSPSTSSPSASSSPSATSSPTTSSSSKVDQLDPQLLGALGVRLLGPVADHSGVRINPRYGVWDQVGIAVASTADQSIGYSFAAHTQP
jgi:hypothetical protein